MIRTLISPSMRLALRDTRDWLREKFKLWQLWNWEIARFPQQGSGRYNILYVGRKSSREFANTFLKADDGLNSGQIEVDLPAKTVFVCELPVPGALCVPTQLRAIVPLGRPIHEILARYDKSLRQNLHKWSTRYRLQQALTDAEIERADRDMIRPFARARHGNAALQLSPGLVRQYARKFGRLDLVLSGEEVVGCQLGRTYTRHGKRYWLIVRFGSPEAVFTDPKRLREINSIGNHLELEWAIENGFDYFDMGMSLARPKDGILQHKRRRGGELDLNAYHHYFYVRLPKAGSAMFLWNTPLFSVENRQLTLHLGLPNGPSDEDFGIHYREMGFGGLLKIYLHYDRQPSQQLLETLNSYFTHQKPPPIVLCLPST